MNKLICILLCILLISLSICPIFATDYTYTDISDFCTDVNNLITTKPSTSFATEWFTDILSSDVNTFYENIVDHFDLSSIENRFACIGFNLDSSNANYLGVFLFVVDDLDYWLIPYISGSNYYTRFQFYNTSNYHVYKCLRNANGNISYSNYDRTSVTNDSYQWSNKNIFAGIYPLNAKVGKFNNNSDIYILTQVQPDPVITYEYIDMTRPPLTYGALWSTLHNAAWDDAAATYPSVYQNVDRGEFMFSDTSPGMNANNIFSAINVCGVLFESYMNHSYDFYDNISYNLATWMNSNKEVSDGIARLTEIYASDQEVEAREAAADNQQAIVDNFLDSEGEGYVSPSDISSVSSMSDGYKTNMSTDAQPSGIWDIFNSNHFGWFSQETVNQLDTSTSNQRGSNTFETPYLDEKIKDIYRSLGVNYDD